MATMDPRGAAYLAAARERVVVFDGAMGTALQMKELLAEDFGGVTYEGCPEILCDTRPNVIADLHRSFFEIGCDVVETNSFGGAPITLDEYGLAPRAHELNEKAARIAREVAAGFPGTWVAGSIGPGTKMPTLGQTTYAELRDAYEVQAAGLLAGGVDLFLVETVYDCLQAKAALVGCRRAMAAAGRQVPLQVQVTIELTGRMLPGTEIGAALNSLDPLKPDVVGLNCATGPAEMSEHLRHLSRHWTGPVSCLPNAGLPSVVEGRMHYNLTPDQLAQHHARFVSELGVTVIGGCCGTTTEHLAAVIAACRDLAPAPRSPLPEVGAASTYSSIPFAQDTSFLVIGERTNANGSKAFKKALLAGDWEGCERIARDQVAEGSHLLDVCVDYVGRDGAADMDEIARRLAGSSTAGIVLDSTEPAVIQAGLERLGARAVLNSANLEDGDAPGSRFDRIMSLAAEHGSAVVCLVIDEEGQARDPDWKLRVAHRIADLASTRYGLRNEDLLFDALTFTLATGGEESRKDGAHTIEGIRRIKAEIPGAWTVLGLSNISFGFSPAIRQVLNSVFLAECVDAGMDAAIVHAARILPLSRIPDEQVEVCRDLIYDRRRDDYDPLSALLDMFAGVDLKAGAVKEDRSGWPVEQRLRSRIIEGDRDGLDVELDEALVKGLPALAIVNDVLLDGMREVGDLFGSGRMQLPFVLKSAETMKAAVAHLEPHMDRADAGAGKGRIVLATVKGDVHDIGKNLVDIILTNNGYQVHNIGIRVPIAEMVAKAEEVGADAIGMSGLLVKSTLIMRENLEELNTRGLAAKVPVLLGGAALTRSYVERDLRKVYEGRLFYGKDAFEGLHTMDQLMELKRSGRWDDDSEFGRVPLPERVKPAGGDEGVVPVEAPDRAPSVATDNEVFRPPFVGSRVVKGISLDEVAGYLNETALFRNQWGFRPEKGENDEAFKDRVRPVLRDRLAEAKAEDILVPQVVYGYFAANSDGNDVVIWKDETRESEWMRFPFPRQKTEPWLCIADFFRPVGSGEPDWAAFHIATMGGRASERAQELFASDRYSDYVQLHGLGVEMAEALAELWHRRIREEWGFAGEDGPTLTGLFRQQYRGGRYSWGYPACPDLEDNEKVAELLEADRIGVEVSEDTGFQYQPEQTTSALICHHPQAKYFVAR
jgi:5-methyltetrahydrofolate--homocysteine methyltransferase